MSCEDFPREACESWNEVGLVYTRNKYGRVCSPPGYALRRKNDGSFKNSLFRGANCSVSLDNNTYNPQLLFHICLDYVAKNISLVESLDGFPDIVGEELFKKVQEDGGFGSDPKNMKLFCEAYGILVLSKLCLSASHILTSNYLEHLQLFVCLTELDVSYCRLGDSHELLSYIAHLHGLTKLSLKENCLSDTGIRKLTIPQRLLKGGLGNLSILDLSLNPSITDDSIKHIIKLDSLTALNLSGTKVTFGSGVPQLMNHTNLCLALDVDHFKSGQTFTVTEGWAVCVINQWREKTKTCTKESKTNAEVEKKSVKFYKSSRSGLMQKAADKNKTISELPTIMLSSAKSIKLACTSSMEKQLPARKCMKDNKENSAWNDQPKKKLKTSGDALVNNVEILEDDFIKQYLNDEKQWKPAQRKCSLLESLDQVR